MLRRPAYVVRAPASEPGVRSLPERGLFFFCLTLTLLVAQVFADDHNSAITTNHLALITNFLDRRSDLHVELANANYRAVMLVTQILFTAALCLCSRLKWQ